MTGFQHVIDKISQDETFRVALITEPIHAMSGSGITLSMVVPSAGSPWKGLKLVLTPRAHALKPSS